MACCLLVVVFTTKDSCKASSDGFFTRTRADPDMGEYMEDKMNRFSNSQSNSQ